MVTSGWHHPKKASKPKEVSLESPPKTELPKVVRTNCDEDDELGTSTIPDLSIASEEEETPLKNAWDHATDTQFKPSTIHLEGKCLQTWVKYQTIDSMEQSFQWDETQLAVRELPTSSLEYHGIKLL